MLLCVAPTAAPMDLRVVNVTSNSAVIVWSPIPPRLANGDVCYVVKIASVSTLQYTNKESLRETKLKVTGLEADTVHLVTVTGHTGKGAGPSSEVMQFRTLKNSELKVHTHYTHTIRTHPHTHTHAVTHAHTHTHTSACLPIVHVCSHGGVVRMHSYIATYVHCCTCMQVAQAAHQDPVLQSLRGWPPSPPIPMSYPIALFPFQLQILV